MKENTAIGLDFGVVTLTDQTPSIHQKIRNHMKSEGYDVEDSDICSVRFQECDETKDVVLFKFVHYSVNTAETEPFFKIEFHYKKTIKESNMKQVVQDLEKQIKEKREELKSLEEAVKSLQKVCKHTYDNGDDAWEVEGHDSHKTHYKCGICGATDSY